MAWGLPSGAGGGQTRGPGADTGARGRGTSSQGPTAKPSASPLLHTLEMLPSGRQPLELSTGALGTQTEMRTVISAENQA